MKLRSHSRNSDICMDSEPSLFREELSTRRSLRLRKSKSVKVQDRFISTIPKESQIQYRLNSTNDIKTPHKSYLYGDTPTASSSKYAFALAELNKIPPTPSKKERKVRYSNLNRIISHSPDLVLDAPLARDDFYCTLLDWSVKDDLLVALDKACYLRSKDGNTTKIWETTAPDYISVVAFSPRGNRALIGSERCQLKIFDISRSTYPELQNHPQDIEVTSAIWKSNTQFVTGDALGTIKFWDTRTLIPTHTARNFHRDKVVGMARSPDNSMIATGGNGYLVNIWDDRRLDRPRVTISSHTSAVKALAWCPWQPDMIATGGGTDDERLLFHDTNTGKLLKSTHTGNQICGIVWSKHYKELLTAHQGIEGHLRIWNFPKMNIVTTFNAHHNRATQLCISPDGQMVASMGDDENVKFWKCFAINPGQRELKMTRQKDILEPTIR
ncbi:WD40-repeat-containing domain protein [Globomyces pollinis-pini]|nr:WD40-repeat-containing domain protein [Globomyces pollinis-pini]